MNREMMYSDGGVTDKTDKDANKLVEKRRKVRGKKSRLKKRKDEGKKTLLGNLRRKRLEKKEKRIQKKINQNPTAQKWRRDGAQKEMNKKAGKKAMSQILTTRGKISKKKLGGFKEESFLEPAMPQIFDDYNN